MNQQPLSASTSSDASDAKSERFRLHGFAIWNVYFFIKFYLYYQGNINFHVLENVAFALFLLLPLNNAWLRTLHQLLASVFAIALFYYDSWLPSFTTMLKQVNNMGSFDLPYIMELSSRIFSIELLSLLFILCLGYYYLKYYIRISVFTSLVIFSILIQQNLTQKNEIIANETVNDANKITATSPQQKLENFYQTEAKRVVDYSNTELKTDFDILIINVCSLAWDDLRLTGLDKHPVFAKFDLLFSQFNSATSYSGPAAIRLLRASCGQTKHLDLYQSVPAQCHLFENLKQLGFSHKLAMNHDGKFDQFEQYVRQNGGWRAEKLSNETINVVQHSFDGSPIYSDSEKFEQWLSMSTTHPNATFYNTVSLHDGNKMLGVKQNLNSLENFHPRLNKLLNDLDNLFANIEKSKRKVMVLMVPEHGAGVAGDKLQISGMREFPSPSITNVPVGIKFFGLVQAPRKTIMINERSSFLALSALIQRTIASDIYGNEQISFSSLLHNLPETEHVAENESSVVIEYKNQYLLKVGQEDWIPYR